MSTRQKMVLASVPTLSRLYMSAAAAAAKARLRKSEPSDELPGFVHEVNGVRISLEHLTNYERLLQGTVRTVAPSAYVHTLAFPVAMSVMTREDFPLPLLGMVHLENTVEHLADVPLDAELKIRAHAQNLAPHRSGTSVDLVCEVLEENSGELLWRGVSVYLAKGVFLPGVDKALEPAAREDFSPPVPTAVWRLGVDTGREFAAVSGDYNPIHLSALSARALGMKSAIAHGMYLVARALEQSGHGSEAGTRWWVSFEAPTYLPATVSVNIADQSAQGHWQKTSFVAYNARTSRRHFIGHIEPLTAP